MGSSKGVADSSTSMDLIIKDSGEEGSDTGVELILIQMAQNTQACSAETNAVIEALMSMRMEVCMTESGVTMKEKEQAHLKLEITSI